tara:strand:+ start:10342 stop:11580 length:1239 start_codon:yes stop_codon:yes gene_type:complete
MTRKSFDAKLFEEPNKFVFPNFSTPKNLSLDIKHGWDFRPLPDNIDIHGFGDYGKPKEKKVSQQDVVFTKPQDYWEDGKIWVYRRYREGLIDALGRRNIGSSVGSLCTTLPRQYGGDPQQVYASMMLAGPMDLGMEIHDLIVVPRKRFVFLGRNGQIWLCENFKLPRKCPKVSQLTLEGRQIWGMTLCQQVIDALTPHNIMSPLMQAKTRYRRLCREVARERVIAATAHGRHRSLQDFARGVSPNWNDTDLVSPRQPTIRHAVLFSLVLALEANLAADIIELAGFIEMKMPVMNRASSLAVYQSSVELLSRLCPAWWAQSYMTNWKKVGSIDTLMRRQFIRIMSHAWSANIPAEAATGIELQPKRSDPEFQFMAEAMDIRLPVWDTEREAPAEMFEFPPKKPLPETPEEAKD